MKKILIDILTQYLVMFPEEHQRQAKLMEYLQQSSNEQIVDWNNFNGHIVAGGFIYANKERKFLLLYHNDLKMYLYPGGHVELKDKNPLEASKREIKEETGLSNLKQLKINENVHIPIDIDTHIVGYNSRLNLPEHYHFDFRYLFMVDKISDINLDSEELSNYKWVKIDELSNDMNYGPIVKKIQTVLLNYKKILYKNENIE